MGRRPEQPLAVVALSGGMDSCVTAAIARLANQLALLHVTYGQRTERRERRAFDEIADFYQVPDGRRLVADIGYLARIGGSSLTDRRIEVPDAPAKRGQITNFNARTGRSRGTPAAAPEGPEISYLSPFCIPNTYVPFRNAHILSIAVSWAEVIGAEGVYIGAVEQDSSGYPDCRPAYFEAFQKLADAGTKPETAIRIQTPVIHMRKAEIVRKGVELGAPLHLTWSCYSEEGLACGKCDSCVLRLRAFEDAGVSDPIEYALRNQ